MNSPTTVRPFVSCNNLETLEENLSQRQVSSNNSMHQNWTLSDAISVGKQVVKPPKIPLASFNHISREVLNLEKSKQFYVDVLGFDVIPRPPFDCEGYWLFGYGVNLHLVATDHPTERRQVKINRIQHFSSALPRVDHIAFITTNITIVKEVLDHHSVYYKHEKPENTGIEQIFLFDPDGNVIEISNCAPDIGRRTCLKEDPKQEEEETTHPEPLMSERSTSSSSESMGDDDDDDRSFATGMSLDS
jgi:glyoxylase I family protein